MFVYKYLKSKKSWFYLCFLIPLLVSCLSNNAGNASGASSGASVPGSDSAGQNILLLSDIHLNPYAGCTPDIAPCSSLRNLIENSIEQWPNLLSTEVISNFEEATNNTLLTRGFDNLASIISNKQIKIVLISGDLLAHSFDVNYRKFAPAEYQGYYIDFCAKTFLYVVQELQKRLPTGSKIYVTLGNNDSDTGNLKMQSKAFLNIVAVGLSKFIDSQNKINFIASFASGGYFSIPLSDKFTLIGLNTNSFTTVTQDGSASKEQLAWFEQELIKAQNSNKKVILFQHIPYGIDLYSAAKNEEGAPTLNYDLQAGYLNLLKSYSSIITTIYAGHFHSEFLSLIYGKIPMIGTIAFSSIRGNNPGFKVANISSDGYLNDYTTYFFSQSTGEPLIWVPLYSYMTTYGNPSTTIAMTLTNFPYDLSDTRVVNYRKYYNGNGSQLGWMIQEDVKWKYYYCGIKYIELQDYTGCIQGLHD